jgi:hypothetical protein
MTVEAVALIVTLFVIGVIWFVVKEGSEITPMDDAGITPEEPKTYGDGQLVEEAIEDLIDDVDLMKLTKKELLSMAEAKGVTATSRLKKAEIVELLK